MKRQNLMLALLFSAGLTTLAFNKIIENDPTYKAIDLANFNNSIRPQDDFYEYANGNWIKNNPIPSTETSWGNFNVLNEKAKLHFVQYVLRHPTIKPMQWVQMNKKLEIFIIQEWIPLPLKMINLEKSNTF